MNLFVPYHVMDSSQDSGLSPMSQYSKRDPGFSVPSMQARVSNLCIQLMFGLCDGDMDPLKPYVTDKLLRHFQDQAAAIAKQGHELHIERPCVLRTEILGYQVLPGEDRIHVRVQTRTVQYVTDAHGKIVSGNRRNEEFASAIWVFTRPTGEETQHPEGVVSDHCPSCGAPVNLYASAKCPYCGYLKAVQQFNWLACSILEA